MNKLKINNNPFIMQSQSKTDRKIIQV